MVYRIQEKEKFNSTKDAISGKYNVNHLACDFLKDKVAAFIVEILVSYGIYTYDENTILSEFMDLTEEYEGGLENSSIMLEWNENLKK